MDEQRSRATPTELAERFAALLCQYQEEHHRLMTYLRDDGVDLSTFLELSDRLHLRLYSLKELKRYIAWLREHRPAGDHPSASPIDEQVPARKDESSRSSREGQARSEVHAEVLAHLQGVLGAGAISDFVLGTGNVLVYDGIIEYRLKPRQVKGFLDAMPRTGRTAQRCARPSHAGTKDGQSRQHR